MLTLPSEATKSEGWVYLQQLALSTLASEPRKRAHELSCGAFAASTLYVKKTRKGETVVTVTCAQGHAHVDLLLVVEHLSQLDYVGVVQSLQDIHLRFRVTTMEEPLYRAL